MIRKLRLGDFLQPGEVFHLQNEVRSQRWGVEEHTHDFVEVFWVYRGCARHSINGETVELKAGDVVFIRAADVHSIEIPSSAPAGLVNIAFSRGHLRDLQRRYPDRRQSWPWTGGRLPTVIPLELSRLAKLQELADQLLAASRTGFELDYFLLNCLHWCLAGFENEPLAEGAPDWLAAACRDIRKIERMRGGVKAWVKLCGRSPEHVSRTTRQWLGMSPTDYVNRIRLAHIERRLRTTSIPVLDLALDAGFSNVGHFYRLFKLCYGLPPHRHRRANRKAII